MESIFWNFGLDQQFLKYCVCVCGGGGGVIINYMVKVYNRLKYPIVARKTRQTDTLSDISVGHTRKSIEIMGKICLINLSENCFR